jgi:hypothetical protein
MARVTAAFGVDTSARRIDIDLPLLDTHGIQRYRLICRGGSVEHLDALSDTSRINWVGDLMCVFNEGNREIESSLLGADGAPPWHTRGQFHWDELVGACGNYPEYGRVRHFRLRGFELTLEARDPQMRDGRLEHLTFAISLRSNARIRSSQAESVGYLHPRGDCGAVKKGVEPRVCRNRSTMSWEECRD